MVWKKKSDGKKVGTEPNKKTKRKAIIPAAFREQIWLRTMGKVYEGKCPIKWCKNTITVHDFHCGHNIPESKGGVTQPDNLIPICARCNLSMGDRYTIDEWNSFGKADPFSVEVVTPTNKWFCCC